MLGRSRNARRSRMLDCGVLIGVYNSCSVPRRPPRAGMSKKLEACSSQRHPVASRSPAKYTPGPGVLTYLWPSIQADRERASSPAGRTKVCSGCKTSAERAAKGARIAGQAQTRVPSSTLPAEECGAAACPRVAMVVGAPSGLHVLSKAAATAMHLQVPPPALSGPPLLVAADDPTGGSHQCASASACRASEQTATDTALSQEPRKPENLSHAHDTPRVSAVPGSVSVRIVGSSALPPIWLLLGDFFATPARRVSPQSRQRGLLGRSDERAKEAPGHTNTQPRWAFVCSPDSMINLNFIVHLMGGAKLVDVFQGARRP